MFTLMVGIASVHWVDRLKTMRSEHQRPLNSTPYRVRRLFLRDVTVEEGRLGSTAP
jgi:hypothetical protein